MWALSERERAYQKLTVEVVASLRALNAACYHPRSSSNTDQQKNSGSDMNRLISETRSERELLRASGEVSDVGAADVRCSQDVDRTRIIQRHARSQ